jgi:hypothetical protein
MRYLKGNARGFRLCNSMKFCIKTLRVPDFFSVRGYATEKKSVSAALGVKRGEVKVML